MKNNDVKDLNAEDFEELLSGTFKQAQLIDIDDLKEASFEELSWTFGEGAEKNQGGRFYKQRIYSIPAGLRSLIRKIRPGEVLKPHKLGEWYVILALDHFEPAQFDEVTKDLLLSIELDRWLHEVSLHLLDQLKSDC